MKQRQSALKPPVGQSRDMLSTLRIQAADGHVITFCNVDTRFNDCQGWEVFKNGERVLFNTRVYEQFRGLKSGLMVTVEVCEGRTTTSDKCMLAAAKSLLALLDKYPSFASLAAHPARTDN
ncbi:hypothetical protein [Metakosakonia massiliensis]|uniref:Uncharacterized protein n=1 Tax=Phytobacter massiliensis TaxID=1485952 RepID=A0A6N3D0A7_9ENTR